ncbi:MAG: c-type cytochrome [Dokdonella sp.]
MAAAPIVGDAKNGAVLAAACQACHGAQGEGTFAAGFPRLAGQTAVYLEKQLNDYAADTRSNAVMAPLAKALSPKQRADLAAHFAGLSPPSTAAGSSAGAGVLARGRLLAHEGDEAKQLQACGNCHGPEGRGEAFAAPYLAGQSATYLAAAIKEWKSGARKNDGGQLMAAVANRLDDADIAAVAAYFESVGPLP